MLKKEGILLSAAAESCIVIHERQYPWKMLKETEERRCTTYHLAKDRGVRMKGIWSDLRERKKVTANLTFI